MRPRDTRLRRADRRWRSRRFAMLSERNQVTIEVARRSTRTKRVSPVSGPCPNVLYRCRCDCRPFVLRPGLSTLLLPSLFRFVRFDSRLGRVAPQLDFILEFDTLFALDAFAD